jgi:hypothetical protein
MFPHVAGEHLHHNWEHLFLQQLCGLVIVCCKSDHLPQTLLICLFEQSETHQFYQAVLQLFIEGGLGKLVEDEGGLAVLVVEGVGIGEDYLIEAELIWF